MLLVLRPRPGHGLLDEVPVLDHVRVLVRLLMVWYTVCELGLLNI